MFANFVAYGLNRGKKNDFSNLFGWFQFFDCVLTVIRYYTVGESP